MENDLVAQSKAKNVSSVGCNTQVHVFHFTQFGSLLLPRND